MDRSYSMKSAAQITGLTPDTIRVWERRYKAVAPSRESTGRRSYSEAEIARLTLLRDACGLGIPIRKAAAMSDAEIKALLADHAEPPADSRAHEALLESIIDALARFDVETLDRRLGSAMVALPPQTLVSRVLSPLLARVGDLWSQGRLTVAQEHLISARLRSITGAFANLVSARPSAGKIAFATFGGERHEFGILFVSWLASLDGWRSFYLGPDLPPAEIASAARDLGVEIIALGAVYSSGAEPSARQLAELRASAPASIEIWLGGPMADRVHEAAGRPAGVRVADLDALLRRLAQGKGSSS